VGRAEELSVLSAALDDPDSGGVALFGPAGIGKTRLAHQLLELASLRGLATIAIRASRSATTIPFAAVAPLFSALGLRQEDADEPFVAVSSALDSRSPRDRLVVMVDDAQHLDQASAALLDQLVGRSGVFVALTVRASASPGDMSPDLLEHDGIQWITVGPLGEADAAQLVRTALGGPVDSGAIQAVVRASGGNVLYLRELVQGALESGALSSSRGIWRLSGSLLDSRRLRDVIERRVLVLTDEEREVVELVALGEPLPLPLVNELACLDTLEGLERRNVIDSSATAHGAEVRLGHPLYGEVVRAQLSTIRRARLCQALADATERLAARSSGSLSLAESLRVALWRLDAGGSVAPHLALSAARAAFRGEDFDLTRRLARTAWEQEGSVEAAILLTEALEVAGRTEEIEEVLAAAYPRASDDSERTMMAARLASSLFVWTDRAADADAALTRAAAEVTDPECLAALRGQRAALQLMFGNVGETIRILSEMAELPSGVPGAQASRDMGTALALAGQTERAIEHTERGLAALHGLSEDEVNRGGVYIVAQVLALAEGGQLKQAADIAEAGYLHTLEGRNVDGQAWFASILGHTLVSQGRLATARHLFRETATAFEELGHPGRRWGLGGIALAAGQMGDTASALQAAAELETVATTSFRIMDIHIARGLAWAAVSSGDLNAARTLLLEAVDDAERLGQMAAAAAALHDLVRIGHDPAARRLAGVLEQVDGALAAARGELARAVIARDADAAAVATDQFEACGALLFAAEAAAVERRLAIRSGEQRRAASAAHRSAQLQAQCEQPATPLLTDEVEGPALSKREREVAQLAADGLTSREIGERLFVSPRTAENHLQRAYVKLGVASRPELSDRLARLATQRPD
jgi:DNA-binding CsgD family transcriptional regulator/predicted ATPase